MKPPSTTNITKLTISTPPGPPLPLPIILQREPSTTSWLRKTTLVGEAVSLDHLGHLPKLILSNGESDTTIKYIGGLKVLILFDHSGAAKEFMEDDKRWKEHIKWLRWADNIETHADRVAWIIIVGLPLFLWGQRNFEKITGTFRKIIAPFDDIPNRIDLSHVKIGILTTRKARINEEIHISYDGKVTRLGIVEFDEDWFPFRFDPSEDYYEVSRPPEDNGTPVWEIAKDGNETQTKELNEEREEGEIWIETQKFGEDERLNEEPPMPENSRAPATCSSMQITGDEQLHGKDAQMTEALMTAIQTTPRNPEKFSTVDPIQPYPHVPSESDDTTPIPLRPISGSLNGLPPDTCFGPFTPHTPPITAQMFKPGESLGKRQRLINTSQNLTTPIINPMADLSDVHPLPHSTPLPESPSGLIDLNTPPIVQSSTVEEPSERPVTPEIVKTV